jgi:hypothetical protein
MRQCQSRFAYFFGALILLAPPQVLAEPVQLRWRFEKGQSSKYEVRQDQETKTPFGSKVYVLKQSLVLDISADVAEGNVSDVANAVIDGRIVRLRLRIVGDGLPDEGVEYDTGSARNPSNDYTEKMASLLRGIVKTPFPFQMSWDGTLDLPKGVSYTAFKPDGLGVLETVLTPQNMRLLTCAGVVEFDERAVDVGDTWRKAHDERLPGGGVR